MKHIICLMFCLVAIMLAFGIEVVSRISEIEKQTNIRLFKIEQTMAQTLEAQEKDIRLLKTDVDILEYGYERKAEK